MLRDADTAMYLAKDLGRDRHEVFGEALRARAVRRMEAQRSLERAVEEGRLRVYYQPIVLAATGRLVGVEALARYEDPEHGVVSPVEFVPIAEATGMIARIDAWVLDRSLAQLRAWGEAHPRARPYVACNLSGRTLARGDLDALVDEALARHGLAAERLCLEMTESTLITATAELRAQLLRIKHRGTRLGLDDFGTGYSSLTYLRELPVSFLKIDRSFVRDLSTDPGARAIVEAVVRLAHALGLTVTAEGVEEDAHPELLRAIGCDQLQGYYYSRPVPPEGLTELLRQAAI
jgi:EAL domain-containing protein (putative c-di-GMP-specific phosphodiesterase class I)